MGILGEKLRQHRERRGLSVDAISNATKISPRMLSALEYEQFDQLPGGVFNKGFVRAYARVVGLDEEEALSDYLAALRENHVLAQSGAPKFRREIRPAQRPELPPRENTGVSSTRLKNETPQPKVIASQVEDRRAQSERRLQPRRGANRQSENLPPESETSELSHAAELTPEVPVPENYAAPSEHYLAEHHPAEYAEDAPTPPPSFLNLSAPPQGDYEPEPEDARQSSFASPVRWQKLGLPLILLTLALALWALHRRNTAASTQTALSPAPAQTVASESAAPSESPASTASLTSTPIPARPTPVIRPAPTPSHSSTPPPATAPAKQSQPKIAKPKPLPSFTLIIRAAKTSWISITSDGQPIAEETLIAPAHTSVRATKEITVKTRNAGALSFSLNHIEIPAQGAEGETRTYTFNANGLQNSPPSSTASR